MANMSDVFGTMTLEGDWTDSMIENLNIVKREWEGWYYSIEPGYFSNKHRSSSFIATGRWSFDTNLEQIGHWTSETQNAEVAAAYKSLCEELAKKFKDNDPTAVIQVDFAEEEGGSYILRQALAEIRYQDGGLKGYVISEDDYEYTKENLVELGFYEHIEDIDWGDEEEDTQEEEKESAAFGEVELNGSSYYGLVADAVMGRKILGNEMELVATDITGTGVAGFTFNGNGAQFNNARATWNNSSNFQIAEVEEEVELVESDCDLDTLLT